MVNREEILEYVRLHPIKVKCQYSEMYDIFYGVIDEDVDINDPEIGLGMRLSCEESEQSEPQPESYHINDQEFKTAEEVFEYITMQIIKERNDQVTYG